MRLKKGLGAFRLVRKAYYIFVKFYIILKLFIHNVFLLALCYIKKYIL
jgi:hypothetical protein